MPKYLVLPKIGLNMEEGVIDEWLVKPGDRVEKEQMVVRAETDKAVQDLFATESGIVYKLLVQPGDVVPCQQRIAILLEEGETYQEEASVAEAERPAGGKSAPTAPAPIPAAPASTASREGLRQRVSPLAKKIAAERDIDLSMVRPAREGDRIVKADVLAYAEQTERAPRPAAVSGSDEGTFVPFTRKRAVIANHMLDSASRQPRVALQATVNCTRLVAWREALKKQRKVGFNELIMKACAAALHKYPEMNRIQASGGYRIMPHINIGLAVDHADGLVVPVMRDVDQKGVLAIAEEFAALVEKARNARLSIDEMTGGTMSVTNLGMFGVEAFDPILNTPECLILGVGCMKEQPVIADGAVVGAKCMKISLSFDHTVFDGAQAARLLQEIVAMLEEPAMMLS